MTRRFAATIAAGLSFAVLLCGCPAGQKAATPGAEDATQNGAVSAADARPESSPAAASSSD
ncbi:MAG: hypothetical protein ACUVQK_09300, partial [Thermogutta sp.]